VPEGGLANCARHSGGELRCRCTWGPGSVRLSIRMSTRRDSRRQQPAPAEHSPAAPARWAQRQRRRIGGLPLVLLLPIDDTEPALPFPARPIHEVLIVDDDPLVARSLRSCFPRNRTRTVTGTAQGGANALSACERLPDVVLMDIRMPGMDGIEANGPDQGALAGGPRDDPHGRSRDDRNVRLALQPARAATC